MLQEEIRSSPGARRADRLAGSDKDIHKGGKRKPRMNPTPEAVARTNFRNAVKMLTAKLNHHFVPGDYHLTLTYEKVKASSGCKEMPG